MRVFVCVCFSSSDFIAARIFASRCSGEVVGVGTSLVLIARRPIFFRCATANTLGAESGVVIVNADCLFSVSFSLTPFLSRIISSFRISAMVAPDPLLRRN